MDAQTERDDHTQSATFDESNAVSEWSDSEWFHWQTQPTTEMDMCERETGGRKSTKKAVTPEWYGESR